MFGLITLVTCIAGNPDTDYSIVISACLKELFTTTKLATLVFCSVRPKHK